MFLDGITYLFSSGLPDLDLAFVLFLFGQQTPAEIALHHAFCARAVRAQLSGAPPEPFAVAGEDWFALSTDGPLSWDALQAEVAQEDDRLKHTLVADRGFPSAVLFAQLGRRQPIVRNGPWLPG